MPARHLAVGNPRTHVRSVVTLVQMLAVLDEGTVVSQGKREGQLLRSDFCVDHERSICVSHSMQGMFSSTTGY